MLSKGSEFCDRVAERGERICNSFGNSEWLAFDGNELLCNVNAFVEKRKKKRKEREKEKIGNEEEE